MIEELRQEIAQLKQMLKNVQDQLVEVLEVTNRREHEHNMNWWYETDGSPETEPCLPPDDGDPAYVPCDDCGCIMGAGDPYCLNCCDE